MKFNLKNVGFALLIITLIIVLVIVLTNMKHSGFEGINIEKKKIYYCNSQGFDGKPRYSIMNIKDDKITYIIEGTTGQHTFVLTKNEEGRFCGGMIHSTNPKYYFRSDEIVCTDGLINKKLAFEDTTSKSTYASKHGQSFNHTYTCHQL